MKKRFGIIAVGVIVDQILKLIIFNTIGASGQTINLIPGIFFILLNPFTISFDINFLSKNCNKTI